MPPTAPANVDGEQLNDGYVRITWNSNPPQENVVGYNVYRGPIGDFPINDESLLAQPTTNQYIDMDVTGQTTYFYKIKAVDKDGNVSPASAVKSVKTPVDKILQIITKWCLVGIAILVVTMVIYGTFFFDKQGFILSIDDTATFTNDDLSGIISNKNFPKMLTIYGLNKTSAPVVSASMLTDKDGDVTIPFKAELANDSIGSKHDSESSRKILLSVSKDDIKPGKFQGIITIEDDKLHSIVIIFSTNPATIQAIIIVGIGILSSVILWEFIKYFRKNNDEEQRLRLLEKSSRDFDEAKRQSNLYNLIKGRKENNEREYNTLNDIVIRTQTYVQNISNNNIAQLPQALQNQIVSSGINPVRQQVTNDLNNQIVELYELEASIINDRLDAKNHSIIESLYTKSSEINKQGALQKTQQVESYKSRYSRKGSLAAKIIVTECGSAVFGISVALFGLLQNDYLIGLRNIGGLEVTILFGLGLGIGSLKEFVDK